MSPLVRVAGIAARTASRAAAVTVAGAALATAMLVTGAPRARAQAPACLLKIATVAPEGSTWMKVMREIDADVRRDSKNAVGFKIYPGGVQGDEQVVLRKVRSGQLHGGGFTGLGLGTIAPALRVLEVPFLFQSYAEIDSVYARVGPHLEAELHQNGFTLLGWAEVGFVYLFSKPPIATHADLRAAKMWLWEGDPLAAAFFHAAGVVPVPLAITDVMTALQTRLVDGVYSSPLACLALQWFTRVKHYTDLPVTFATGAVVVSNESFARVPPQDQAMVLDICRARFRDLVLRTRKENAEALVQVDKSGVRRVQVLASEVQSFESVGRGVWQEEAGKLYPQALLDEVLKSRALAGTGAGGR